MRRGDGYLGVRIGITLLAACVPQVHGRLVDALTGEPVAGVWVANDGAETQTDARGEFALDGRGRISLGGACALQALDLESAEIRVLRWRGFKQRVPDGIVAIEGAPVDNASNVLRYCMPDRGVRVTLADGSFMTIEPPHYE